MRRHTLIAGLAVASVVLPAAGSAGADRRRLLYERAFEDVGTWDAVATVRLPDGQFRTLRGVEVNTIGCGGTCIESTLTPVLAAIRLADASDGGTAFRRSANDADTRPPMRRDKVDSRVGSDGLGFTPGWGGDGVAAGTPTRTAMTYVSPNRRILTIFARVRGAERLQMRVEYTRR